MSSIIRRGWTYHGISVFGRGVVANDESSMTYAGQCKDGYACGLGVLTYSRGSKEYAEHGPDGQFDGRCVYRDADGYTIYRLFECGEEKEYTIVYANGLCYYNGEACAPNDPRFLALIAQVAPVEVRPAVPAPTRHQPATRLEAVVRWIGRFAPAGVGLSRGNRGTPPPPPRRTPSLGVVRHNPTTAALQRTTTQ
jgi:hypothetical protein